MLCHLLSQVRTHYYGQAFAASFSLSFLVRWEMCSRPLEYSTTRTLSWRSCERPGPEAEGEHSIEDKNDSQSLQVPFVSNTVMGILCFLSRLSRVWGGHVYIYAQVLTTMWTPRMTSGVFFHCSPLYSLNPEVTQVASLASWHTPDPSVPLKYCNYRQATMPT